MKRKIYNAAVIVLCLLSVMLAVLDLRRGLTPAERWVDWTIYALFVGDYLIRLSVAKEKKAFFRENVFDLIAIIPFSALFRIFRLARFVRVLRFMRLFRAAAISTRFLARLRGLLDTNGFKYMLILSVGAILASAAAMMYVEGMSFMDALWWSFVTATTVGYGDLSPSSGAGRIIAAGLMIVGIGLIGSLTSSITSFFLVRDTDKAYSSDRVEMVAAMYKMLSDEEKESFRKTCFRSDEVQIESARTGHQ